MKISKGMKEQGIPVGNYYDKYNTRNPLARRIMKNFDRNLSELVGLAAPRTLHEVGCGEGVWVLKWCAEGILARGSDFSEQVIELARNNAKTREVGDELFEAKSIYELSPEADSADLVVCCEVLEHLTQPAAALVALQKLDAEHYIFSVPREPLWCGLNMLRGKYLKSLGNTPGHINHWSQLTFISLVSSYFEIVEVRSPTPWTMLLCRKLPDEG